MKKSGIMLKSMLALNLLVFLLTILDFLALHDIQNDYVSAEALQHLQIIGSSAPPPAWTATTGEWQIVSISFWLRTVFILTNLLLLWQLSRKATGNSTEK